MLVVQLRHRSLRRLLLFSDRQASQAPSIRRVWRLSSQESRVGWPEGGVLL